MAPLADYLKWRGDLPLEYDGFCELDAAILSWLAYLPFERLSQGALRQGMELTELCAYMTAASGVEELLVHDEDLEFCRLVSQCARYRGARLHSFTRHFDAQTQTQFAAMCVLPGDGRCCLVYRGTDNTLVGWKEDLNLGLTFPIPAQSSALEYLERSARELPDCGRITVCGHSKGGNLAIYAASFCPEETQRRIDAVYNFDGPGFEDRVLGSEGYRRVRGRILTFVPQFSVIGLLFDIDRPFTVVHSDSSGMNQHNLSTWQAEGRRFRYAQGLTDASRMLDSSLDQWFREMGPEEREGFVEAVYRIFTQNNAQTLKELSSNRLDNAVTTLKTLRKLDDRTRKSALKAVQLLMSSLKNEMLAETMTAAGKDGRDMGG